MSNHGRMASVSLTGSTQCHPLTCQGQAGRLAEDRVDGEALVDLRDYLRVLRKGWATILAFVVVGIGIGVGLTLVTTKTYEASVQLFAFVPSTGSDPSAANQGNLYAEAAVQSLTAAANSPTVTGAVITELHLKGTDDELAAKITADAPLNKVLINVHVTDTDPARAASIANAVAGHFTTFAAKISGEKATSKTTKNSDPGNVIRLTILHPASVPSSPIKPNKILNIGLGLIVGLLLGVGVAVLREVLDNTVKGPRDFDELGVAVLGLVPFDKRTPRSPIAFRTDPHSARSESYRQVRTNMQFVDVDNPPKIIAVTSAVPGEGKTTTALNLAAALAEAGARVCLVEADLRKPSIADALGLVGDVGFTTVLIGKAPVETVLQNAGRNLAVLTSGPIPPNPSELLISRHARQLISDLAANVDYLIIDTPPLLPVSDGAELATIADATLLVHRAGKTTRDQALRSVEALAKVGKRPVGVILNMITRTTGKYDYEYAYYYAPYRPDRAAGKGAVHRANGVDESLDLLGEPDPAESTAGSSGNAGQPAGGTDQN
jgi:capsular exopolysaccharide synthesis family protein